METDILKNNIETISKKFYKRADIKRFQNWCFRQLTDNKDILTAEEIEIFIEKTAPRYGIEV